MDAEQWLDCEMWLMITYINQKSSERKKRLLATAFCRNISHLITKRRGQVLLKEAKRLSVWEPTDKPDCLLLALAENEKCADGIMTADELAPISEVAQRLSSVGDHFTSVTTTAGARKTTK